MTTTLPLCSALAVQPLGVALADDRLNGHKKKTEIGGRLVRSDA
jgi:hypothetical protein